MPLAPAITTPHTLTHRTLATIGLLGLLSAGVVVGHSSEAFAEPDLATCSSGDTSTYGGGGDGSSNATAIEIRTKEELFLLSETPGDWNKHFVLTEDLNIAGCEFARIGRTPNAGDFFSGTFDGGGKTIEGLTVREAGQAGLFGVTKGATLRDISLVTVSVTPRNPGEGASMGSIVGQMEGGSLVDSSVSGNVEVRGLQGIGGMVGYLNGGSIEDSTVEGSLAIEASRYGAGGIVGYADNRSSTPRPSILNSHVNAQEGSTIRGASNGDAGGIAGYMSPGEVADSSASGTLEVSGVGWAIGGLVGSAYGSESLIKNSTVGSRITMVGTIDAVEADAVGGFVGYNEGNIVDSYTLASVAGPKLVGGFVGWNDGGAISRSFSAGSVRGTNAQGFAGQNDDGTITNSFWDVDTSGLGTVDETTGSDGGVGKSTDQMTTFATFSDAATVGLDDAWPIVDGWAEFAQDATPPRVWGICSQVEPGYPFLLWQFDNNPCVESEPEVTPEPEANVTEQTTSTPTTPSAPREKQADSPAIHLDLQATVGQRVAGTTVVIGGQGLAPGSTMTLVVRSTPQTLATGTVSSLGNFSTKISLPALSPGSHTLTLSGTAPDGSLVTLTQGFSVSAEGTFSALGSVAGAQTVGLAVTGPASSLMWSGLGGLGLMLAGLALAAARTGLRIKQSL